MIQLDQAARGSQLKDHARNALLKFKESGTIGGKSESLDAGQAKETMAWAEAKIQDFVNIEAGGDQRFPDRDSVPGSIQTNFYDDWRHISYQAPDPNGAFSFTEAVTSRDTFDTPQSNTTSVEFDGTTLNIFRESKDAWGEGSSTAWNLTDAGGAKQHFFFD